MLPVAVGLLAVAGLGGGFNASGRPTVEKIVAHLRHFETAAKQHGNSRSILKGYNASADYVISQLRRNAPSLRVATQHFTVPVWTELAPPQLAIVGADPPVPLTNCDTRTGWQHYPSGCDFSGVRYGGNGTYDITTRLAYVAQPCSRQGFAGFPSGSAALIDVNGQCDYYTMALLAEAAGAAALLIAAAAGSAGTPGSRVIDSATWKVGDPLVQIPAVGVTAAVAAALRQSPRTLRVVVSAKLELAHTYNVIAETADADGAEVVMVGAHLDSVPEGPGINDNGSGSAMVLQLALDAARTTRRRRRKLRFAWWGAEEIGLLGSRFYVDDLVQNQPAELARLAGYLNFDMEAGPNYIRMVYDGSSAPEPARPGSTDLQRLFEQAWRQEGKSYAFTPMTGGSDFLPFILAGVPSSGIATGAGGVKSAEERSEHGGLANSPLDPCYHAPCDTVENVSPDCLRDCDAALRSVLAALAYGTGDLPRRPAPLPPAATAARYRDALRRAKSGFHLSCDAHDEDEHAHAGEL
eukprot:TRINITY_DN64891_c0_g1_i1.p1 TRINITY_DN64891_c0_g1~~TRINITY_DN64891_c0_g1_i1.p1  ORF type:complete len:523 (+),score=156.85 TRINITY_DN64891_c0_g1_i1:77-1645(+)